MGSPVLKAATWMLGTIFSFTVMAIAGRAVSLELDTFEIMTYRSIVGLIIVSVVAYALGTLKDVAHHNLSLHLIRNIGHFAGQNLWFFALTAAPLAHVFALEFTSPIWVILIAPFILKEPLTQDRVFVAAIGFLGILLVTRPWTGAPSFGLLSAALAAIGFAISAVYTRLLTRHETITSILFWLTLMQLVFGLVCAGIDGAIALPSARTLPGLFVIACAGLLAHLCLTKALSIAPASLVMPFDFVRLPVIIVVGIVLYQEPFDLFVLAGGVVIFASSYLNIISQNHKKLN